MVAKLGGVIVPVPNAFTKDYELDEQALADEVGFLTDKGFDGLLINGSTGEFTTLSSEERKKTLEVARNECKNKLFIIGGVELPSTREALEESKRARAAGVDFALVSTPYYLKATQEGVYAHYQGVLESGVPSLLYNNPFRTDVNLGVQLVKKLAGLKGVAGIKQSNVDLNQTAEMIMEIGGKISFIHSYGDSVSLFPGLTLGGAGCMMLSALLIPDEILELYDYVKQGEVEKARTLLTKLLPLMKVLGGGVHGEPNPAPIKEALRLVGRPVGPTRLPGTPVTKDTTALLRNVLRDFKLLKG